MRNDSDFQLRLDRAGLMLSELNDALERLREALARPEDAFIRDASIKRFEFCFELAWKSIQSIARLEGQDCVTPRAAFSLAWQARWLEDEGLWLDVLDAKGNRLFVGELKGERRFPLGAGLKVMAGRPDLVTVQVAGASPRVLGRIEQVTWLPIKAP